MSFTDLDSDLRENGSLEDVPMKWRNFVLAIVGMDKIEAYDRHNDKLRFQSVLMSLAVRDNPPFSKQVIYDTLKSPEVGLFELAAQWKREYMVSMPHVLVSDTSTCMTVVSSVRVLHHSPRLQCSDYYLGQILFMQRNTLILY